MESEILIKGVVYGIFKSGTGECLYVGSTKNYKKRKHTHKSNCFIESNKSYHLKIYELIRDIGWDFIHFETIENIVCENKDIIRKIEQVWYERLNPIGNIRYPGRDTIQYRQTNKKNKIQYDKQYHEDNKDTINKKNRTYYENNKDTINNKHKIYYENNKDKIKIHQNKIMTCECGFVITKKSLSKHIHTKKHINFIEQVLYNHKLKLKNNKKPMKCLKIQ